MAKLDQRAVPIDLLRQLAFDKDASVAVRGTELLHMLSGVTGDDRSNYRHRFGM